MSPIMTTPELPEFGFPRVSGDEPPSNHAATSTIPFSPRERG